MKKLLLLLLPLFFVGCIPRGPRVYCQDAITKIVTFDGYSYGPVYAFVTNGHSILFFHTREGKKVLIYLSKNDCGVN